LEPPFLSGAQLIQAITLEEFDPQNAPYFIIKLPVAPEARVPEYCAGRLIFFDGDALKL
jgi:hypothetical protein